MIYSFNHIFSIMLTLLQLGGELIKIDRYVGNLDFFKFRAGRYFLKYGSRLFFKNLKKTPISILIANEDANTTP